MISVLSRLRRQPSLLALSLIGVAGFAISIYLTSVHYARVPLACSASGVVNCERVLSSSYSTVAGVPVSVGGMIWFTVLLVLAGVALTNEPEPGFVQTWQVLWGLLGLATVFYLIGVEALALGVLCAWCTALHVLIIASLLLALLRHPNTEPGATALPATARGR